VWFNAPMPTEVSLVAGASSLTASARKALRTARDTQAGRLVEEGNVDPVDRALDALEYAAGVLDSILGRAPDEGMPVRVRQGPVMTAEPRPQTEPVRHEAEELQSSIMAFMRSRTLLRHEHEELAVQSAAARMGPAYAARRPLPDAPKR
jgi:hypothetical protein